MTCALRGRRFLVTGASRGIGRVVAMTLAGHGASLALVARDGAALDRVVDELEGNGHHTFALDVRDALAWSDVAADLRRHGGLDGAVTAAAALTPVGLPGTWDIAQFRETVDVNLTGTMLAVLTFLQCQEGEQGSIVTFSGGGGTKPLARFDAYAASKAAVVRLTENLAWELSSRGIRANCVAPGFVATEMHQATLAAGVDAVGREYYEQTRAAVAGGGGDPPELAADLVAFLLSDEADGISGKLISARWDPWREPGFQKRLREQADLATLRRIDDQFFRAANVSDR